MKTLATILSSAILLGLADSKKMAGTQVGPPEAEIPNKGYRDAQPNLGISHGRC